MTLRSFLFIPADSVRKLEKALRTNADALILDLEDSVAPKSKDAARRGALDLLRHHRPGARRQKLFVRINALASGLADGDLDVVMTGAPDGIVLPKALSGADVTLLDAKLAVREALHGLEDGSTCILALALEASASLFNLGTYRGASPRLAGLGWGAEDLAAEIGARTNRVDGAWTSPFALVRNLALFAANAAGVPAIDSIHAELRDVEGLRRSCAEAVRDGFSGKLAIHPDQVEPINEAFTPAKEAIAAAEAIVAAFAEAGGVGVVSFGGRMLDRAHLLAAERLLAPTAPPPQQPAPEAQPASPAAAEPDAPNISAPPDDAPQLPAPGPIGEDEAANPAEAGPAEAVPPDPAEMPFRRDEPEF
jgi:citrate lyase subunit beta/citryl-CoA lyase